MRVSHVSCSYQPIFACRNLYQISKTWENPHSTGHFSGSNYIDPPFPDFNIKFCCTASWICRQIRISDPFAPPLFLTSTKAWFWYVPVLNFSLLWIHIGQSTSPATKFHRLPGFIQVAWCRKWITQAIEFIHWYHRFFKETSGISYFFRVGNFCFFGFQWPHQQFWDGLVYIRSTFWATSA